MQLKDAKIVNEVHSKKNIYMHDHQTGMPRGHIGPMLCMAAAGQTEEEDKASKDNNNKSGSVPAGGGTINDAGNGEVNAATKGDGKGKWGPKGTANVGIAASGAIHAGSARTSATPARPKVP